jgi:isopentenyl-diphosphate Delta-isomerase
MSTSADILAAADPIQRVLMQERVILVTPSDSVIGDVSKERAHSVAHGLPLHRAFSVILFDHSNRMLVQQRAAEKVTFPLYWANACCSHPLFNPEELGYPEGVDAVPDSAVVDPDAPAAPAPAPAEPTETASFAPDLGPPSAAPDPVLGVKRAAVRKLAHELGVEPGVVTVEDLNFLSRIHYRAECGDGVWGEHELDYVLVARLAEDAPPMNPSPNEVQEARFMLPAEVHELFRQADEYKASPDTSPPVFVSPWFRTIMVNMGFTWWYQMKGSDPFKLANSFADRPGPDGAIHSYGGCAPLQPRTRNHLGEELPTQSMYGEQPHIIDHSACCSWRIKEP